MEVMDVVPEKSDKDSRRERLLEKISKVKRKYQSLSEKGEDGKQSSESQKLNVSENSGVPSRKKVHYNLPDEEEDGKAKGKRKSKKSKQEATTAEQAGDVKPLVEENGEGDEAVNDVWSSILKNAKLTGSNYEDSMEGFLLEKLKAIVKDPTNVSVQNDYITFMSELSVMFEKLRRFPKMISKFLICIRTEIVNKFDEMDGDEEEGSIKHQHKPWADLVLPTQFKLSIGPIVSLLPSGQIIDLWKALHHNLEEECIKKISNKEDTTGVRHFLTIVVDLLVEFLVSLKVSDTSVPLAQIEQITGLMLKLKDNCLGKLGSALLQKSMKKHRKLDPNLLVPFLKLSYTWTELHSLMLLYNSKYRAKNEVLTVVSATLDDNDGEDDDSIVSKKLASLQTWLSCSYSPFNLSCLLPYLDPPSWTQILEKPSNVSNSNSNADRSSQQAISQLVAQKMKYLRILKEKCNQQQKQRGENKENFNNSNLTNKNEEESGEHGPSTKPSSSFLILEKTVSRHLKEAADFLCLQEEQRNTSELFNSQVFPVAAEALEFPKIIQLAGHFVRQVESAAAKRGSVDSELMEIDDDGVKIEQNDGNNHIREENSSNSASGSIDNFDLVLAKLNDNPVFCTSVLLESSRELVRRIGKMNLQKEAMKNLSSNIISNANLPILLEDFMIKASGGIEIEKSRQTSNEIMAKFLNCVNDLIDDTSSTPSSTLSEGEFCGGLIKDLLEFLSYLPLEEYSKELKSFLGLFSISVFIALKSGGENETNCELKSVRDLVGKIIIKTVGESRGNNVLFGVKWSKLFKLLTSTSEENVSSSELSIASSLDMTTRQVLRVVLSNIYISVKSIDEFQPILHSLLNTSKTKKKDQESNNNNDIIAILSITLEFLVEELGAAANVANKSTTKSTPFIERHMRELTHFVVEFLQTNEESGRVSEIIDVIEKEVDPDKGDDTLEKNSRYLVRVFRLSAIVHLALKTLTSKSRRSTTPAKDSKNKEKKEKVKQNIDEDHQQEIKQVYEDLSTLTQVFPALRQNALNFLKKCKNSKVLKKYLKKHHEDLHEARESALQFLHSICKGGNCEDDGWKAISEIPQGFVGKLWNICIKGKKKELEQEYDVSSKSKIKISNQNNKNTSLDSLPLDIYQVCSVEEFETICDSIIEEIGTLSSSSSSGEEGQGQEQEQEQERPDELKMKSLTHLVDKLVDAELVCEKRTGRRRVIEEYLFGILNCTLYWSEYSPSSYLPVLDLQCKILRRRNAMASQEALATCFASITSIPLTNLNVHEHVSVFKDVFCKGADLLNALMVHRLDVLTFRTHIVLQCFQSLVENLTRRADQKNKLNDAEIFDLRKCAHAMERICQSAKLGQKEFARVSPYFVAILMKYFEMFTVYPAVKNPLMSGCYKLLDLCDEHGISQVNSMLSVGSREIFKSVYDLYKKFYRYTGKV